MQARDGGTGLWYVFGFADQFHVGDLRQQGAQFGTRQAGVVDDHDAQWRLVHCGISSVARTM